MKIYCDFDSVLFNLLNTPEKGWLHYLNKKHGTDYVLEDIIHWKWLYDTFPDAGNFFHKGRYSQCAFIEGAKEFVLKLQCLGEVSILTATSTHMLEEKEELIKNHFNVPVIHEKEKYKYADGILIDDNFLNCYRYTKAGGKAILYTHFGRYSYNDFIWVNKDFYKAESYEDILEILKEVTN